MNNERDIIVTAPDYAELASVIAFTGKVSHRAKWELRLLENELKRAQIVPSEEVPPDVITMNTRAEFLDVESGERMEFTLVLPADADINDGKISVLAPLGTAMLGYRVGGTFKMAYSSWDSPLEGYQSALPARKKSPTRSLSRLAGTERHGQRIRRTGKPLRGRPEPFPLRTLRLPGSNDVQRRAVIFREPVIPWFQSHGRSAYIV